MISLCNAITLFRTAWAISKFVLERSSYRIQSNVTPIKCAPSSSSTPNAIDRSSKSIAEGDSLLMWFTISTKHFVLLSLVSATVCSLSKSLKNLDRGRANPVFLKIRDVFSGTGSSSSECSSSMSLQSPACSSEIFGFSTSLHSSSFFEKTKTGFTDCVVGRKNGACSGFVGGSTGLLRALITSKRAKEYHFVRGPPAKQTSPVKLVSGIFPSASSSVAFESLL
mmetsp:Transcript_20702/g.34160  ORF Transcript_20702/g.34160 Transcript_20702/m.34160 type:complete len:224 (-) Transcript_20702:2388-3059(-)